MEKLLENLNTLKSALENLCDDHLLEARMSLLEIVEECLTETEWC
jgi:hypothetical protein